MKLPNLLPLYVITAGVLFLQVTSTGQIPKKQGAKFSASSGINSDMVSSRPPKINSKIKPIGGKITSPEARVSDFPLTGMSGTYHVPGSNHDGYPLTDIGSAISLLNTAGLVGDVVFELWDTSYVESPIVVGGGYQNAGTYNVVMKPAAGISVNVHFRSTLSNGKGFVFNGAKNITIDGVNAGGSDLKIDFISAGTVFPIDDPFGATVYITGASEAITIRNVHIKGQTNNTVWEDQTEGRPAYFIYAADSDGGPSVNITLDSCIITNATYAIKALPQSNARHSVDGFIVNNCRIGEAYGGPITEGALVEYAANVSYTNNVTDGVTYLSHYWYEEYTEYDNDIVWGVGPFMYNVGQATGGHWLMIDEGTFANNVFRNITTTTANGDGIICYGIRVYGYDLGYGSTGYAPTLYNNLIYGITNDDGSGQIVGIRGQGSVDIYHNSVRLTGTNANSPNSTCCKAENSCNVKNNALSNEMIQDNMSWVTGVTTGGTIDGNAIYSAGWPTNNQSTVAGAVQAGVNQNGTWGSLNFSTDLSINCPSAADNSGSHDVLPAADRNGQPRDTTATGVRDAGAYEFSTCPTPFGPDLFPVRVVAPAYPVLACSQDVRIMVKNNSNIPVGPFGLSVVISGPENYSSTGSVFLSPMQCKIVTMPNKWNPQIAINRTATVSTILGGDVDTGNDIITSTLTVWLPDWFNTVFTFDAGPQGWIGTTGPGSITDWKRSNSFTKLDGPFSGYSWVVERPDNPSTYTEGAYASSQGYPTTYPGPNLLTSPVFDLTCYPYSELNIGFWHSLRTEPNWDRSWMQYTTDGIIWKQLGRLNDPNGVNWYSEALFNNALLEEPMCDWSPCIYPYKDELNFEFPLAGWTSNGEGFATGPFGWIISSLKITPAEYPDIIHSPYLQFRYVAYSDAATASDQGGWAFDNFWLSPIVPVDAGGSIEGVVFHDLDGDGLQDAGEPGDDNVKMYFYYHDFLMDSINTSGGGHYEFNLAVNNGIPGGYRIKCIFPGYAFTIPYGVSGAAEVFHPADWSTLTQDFGRYLGSVSGIKFEDLNGNNSKDPDEFGLGGWTIELHKDSANGEIVNSVITASDGAYTMLAPPYPNYLLKESLTDTMSVRQTYPAAPGTYSFSISGTSGDTYAIINGLNFGNFIKSILRIEATQDVNGDGVRSSSDSSPLPDWAGTIYFDILKNGSRIVYDSLLSSQGFKNYTGIDLGTYLVRVISPVPSGWMKTNSEDSITITVDRSGYKDTVSFLYFHQISVNGMKFNDLDLDGVRDANEHGLPGWSISITGTGGGVTVTDSGGYYRFTGVGPGQHTISEIQQTGWVQSAPPEDNFTFSAITADQGGNKEEMDFGNYFSAPISFTQGWNLISLPVMVPNGRSDLLFPSPIYSTAFSYNSSEGRYSTSDTIYNCIGYWIKSTTPNTKLVTGYPIESDSFLIMPGWNLIGSISEHIPISSITSIPAGLTVSQFFGYHGQYLAHDTLHPGEGYWVKAGEEGIIFLSSGNFTEILLKNKIRTVPISELPPHPPFSDGSLAEEIPKECSLGQNYPNPFNPVTTIRYGISDRFHVIVGLYNMLGEQVALLVRGEKDAGYHEVTFNADGFPSGVYFYKMQAGDFIQTKKLLLLK